MQPLSKIFNFNTTSWITMPQSHTLLGGMGGGGIGFMTEVIHAARYGWGRISPHRVFKRAICTSIPCAVGGGAVGAAMDICPVLFSRVIKIAFAINVMIIPFIVGGGLIVPN